MANTRHFILAIVDQLVRNLKSLFKVAPQQRMFFNVLAVDVLVPEARIPLAIPADTQTFVMVLFVGRL